MTTNGPAFDIEGPYRRKPPHSAARQALIWAAIAVAASASAGLIVGLRAL